MSRCVLVALATIAPLVVVFPGAASWSQSSIRLESTAFAAGATIPQAYTCTDADKSPPLAWQDAPQSARTIAIVVDDPDAPSGVWVHWVLYNLPARVSRLAEGVAKTTTLPNGASQGVNDFGKTGYNGPCPPPGRPHHYRFRLFALDSELNLRPGASAADLEAATKGHVVASTELVGIFGR